MSKKNRRKAAASGRAADRAVRRPAGARTATPARPRTVIDFVERPFEGMAVERELVAMREILPLATLAARTTAEHGGCDVVLTTILPSMAGALCRADGVLLVAAQTVTNSGDASLDIAARIQAGLGLRPGEAFQVPGQPDPGPRLQDVLDPEGFGRLELHEQPTFWMTDRSSRRWAVRAARACRSPPGRGRPEGADRDRAGREPGRPRPAGGQALPGSAPRCRGRRRRSSSPSARRPAARRPPGRARPPSRAGSWSGRRRSPRAPRWCARPASPAEGSPAWPRALFPRPCPRRGAPRSL